MKKTFRILVVLLAILLPVAIVFCVCDAQAQSREWSQNKKIALERLRDEDEAKPSVPPVVAELLNEELGIKQVKYNVDGMTYQIKSVVGEGGKYKRWQDARNLGETTKPFTEWLRDQYEAVGIHFSTWQGPWVEVVAIGEVKKYVTTDRLRKVVDEYCAARSLESDQNQALKQEQREAEKKAELLTPKKIAPIPVRIGKSNTCNVPPMTSSSWDDGLNEYGIWTIKWGMEETEFKGELLVPETPMSGINVYRNVGAAESGKPVRTSYGVGTPRDNKTYYFRTGKLCAVKMVFAGLGTNDSVDNVLHTLHKKYDGSPKRTGTNCQGLFPAIETTETVGGVLFTSLEWNVGNVSIHFKYWPPLPKLQEGKGHLTTEQVRQPAYADLFYVYHGTKYRQPPYVKPPAKYIKKDGKWVQVPGTGGLAK
jgi:hypothetical protein